MVDNPIHHGGYFNPPWWILEFTKFTCFILLICIFIFQQTQKQDGGYLNPQNKWNVGSDAFIIAQNINHNRERGYFLKPFYTFYTLTIQSESKPRWRLSTVSIIPFIFCGLKPLKIRIRLWQMTTSNYYSDQFIAQPQTA